MKAFKPDKKGSPPQLNQINIRLTEKHRDYLSTVAGLSKMSPTEMARQMVVHCLNETKRLESKKQ